MLTNVTKDRRNLRKRGKRLILKIIFKLFSNMTDRYKKTTIMGGGIGSFMQAASKRKAGNTLAKSSCRSKWLKNDTEHMHKAGSLHITTLLSSLSFTKCLNLPPKGSLKF